MDLKSFIQSKRGVAVALGGAIGVNPVLVRQWASGSRPIPVEHCAALEEHTGRQVMRWDLRPDDWRRIWPELIDSEGSPPLNNAANTTPFNEERRA